MKSKKRKYFVFRVIVFSLLCNKITKIAFIICSSRIFANKDNKYIAW